MSTVEAGIAAAGGEAGAAAIAQRQQQVSPTPAATRQQQQNMQLLLYDDPHSEYCAKVKVAMYYKGLSWESIPVKPCGSEAMSPEFQQRVPLGKIPALVVTQQQEGQWKEVVLYESEVINEWFEDEFPDPPLLPTGTLDKAKARLISRFHDLYLEPALRKLYPQVAPANCDRTAVAAAAAEFTLRLQQLEQLLASRSEITESPHTTQRLAYAVGDHLTIADCGYPGLLLYAEMIWPVLGLGQLCYEGVPRIKMWRDTLWADEHVVKVLQELQPAAQEWVDSKLAQVP